MKRLFIGLILPILCLVSLVGTAFATWYFDNNLKTSLESSLGVTVERYAQVGNLTLAPLKGNLNLNLDQPNKNNQGILLSEKVTAQYTPAKAGDKYPENLYAQDLKYVLKVEVKIPLSLSHYIAMKESTTPVDSVISNGYNSTTLGNYVVWTKEMKPKTITDTLKCNIISVNADDFIYTKNVPTTLNEYNNMKTTINNEVEKVQIVFSAILTGEHFTEI